MLKVKAFFTMLAGLMFGLFGQAHAAVPAEVTTALADLKTDAMVVAGAFLVAAIAIAAFMYMKKPAGK